MADKSDTSKASTPSKTLTPAAESGDPEVQRLLGELQTATLNGTEDDQKAIRKQLADLGFSS
jgi:hypothetical protein